MVFEGPDVFGGQSFAACDLSSQLGLVDRLLRSETTEKDKQMNQGQGDQHDEENDATNDHRAVEIGGRISHREFNKRRILINRRGP